MVENQSNPDKSSTSTLPKFGTLHLLALMAGIAICFGLSEILQDLIAEAFGEESMLQTTMTRVLTGIHSAIQGIGVAGVFWLLIWRKRSGPIEIQPGHWILMASAASFIVSGIVNGFLFRFVDLDQFGTNNMMLFLIQAIAPFVTVIFTAVAFFRCVGIWKSVFGLASLKFGLDAVTPIVISTYLSLSALGVISWIQLGLGVLIGILFLAAIIVDLVKKRKRDWIHWTGIWLMFLLGCMTITTRIYYTFIFKWT